uniref:Uncharacterized protein n=1 Tax=Steinernema glaseri TaxID=37863 RepID=A0A1I7XXR5_9BILA
MRRNAVESRRESIGRPPNGDALFCAVIGRRPTTWHRLAARVLRFFETLGLEGPDLERRVHCDSWQHSSSVDDTSS